MIEMTHVHGFCTLCAKNEKRIAELEAELADKRAEVLVWTAKFGEELTRAEKAEAEVERLNGSGLLCPPGYTCYWRKQRILGLQGGERESGSPRPGEGNPRMPGGAAAYLAAPDTSGEASPTRVASPPLTVPVCTCRYPFGATVRPEGFHEAGCPAHEVTVNPAAPTRFASPPHKHRYSGIADGAFCLDCGESGWFPDGESAARKERDDG